MGAPLAKQFVRTDQPFRGGSDGSTQGVSIGSKVLDSQDIGTQVEPEVIRPEVQQEGELDSWKRDAPPQARHPQDARRAQGDKPQAGDRHRNQRSAREGREDAAQAHIQEIFPQVGSAQVRSAQVRTAKVGCTDKQQ